MILKEIAIDAPGSIEGTMYIDPGVWQCGEVTDGVGIRMKPRGGFVISFANLEKAYLAAKKFRENVQS